MSFQYISKLPTPQEIKEQLPISEELKQIKNKRDAEIADVFRGRSDKFLLIIGPCSADNEDAVCEYIRRLSRIQEDVAEKIIIIPRIYTNKPRTTGDGYKGMLHQPDPEKKPDLLSGLKAIRKMHIRALTESHLTAADEMLYPENYEYFSDILSYVAIGARSVEDQQHRLVSSGMDIPVGMKNPTSGDFSVMANSIYAANHGHTFIYNGSQVKTDGNDLTHAVLRGAVNKHGICVPNYHYEDLIRLHDMLAVKELDTAGVIVDTNHSNSNKKYKEQIRIAKEILHSKRNSAELKSFIKGLMIESYLEEGAQKIGEHIYGKSITDPCLGFEDSKNLIYHIADIL